MVGSLTDDQLKEFDAYLSGSQPVSKGTDFPEPEEKIIDEDKNISETDTDYLDKIVDLHNRKAKDIMDLLDKIDAKAHKDVVADLVDEMQYQKGVAKREADQLGQLKQLFAQALEATK